MALVLAAALISLAAASQTQPSEAQGAPPPSSAGIFPLANVHAGLHGTAWTVFQGSAPEPFGVDILGVLRNAQGPGQDLILARLTGAKAEYTGVVAGMSGSPVYIDGKLVGALGFRIGEFSKEPIGGITPIEQMLPVRDLDAAKTDAAKTDAAQTPKPTQTGQIQPIETPLVFSGFSAQAMALWQEHAPALGFTPQTSLGGGSQSATAPDTLPPLGPGSAVSALLVSGDLEIAATCTVTYLDRNRLLACGHPLMQSGTVSLPMTKADVLATLPSTSNSFKIINTGAVVGSFTQDRQTAIGGLLGTPARTIPVEIELRREGAAKTLHLQVLDQPQMTPTVLLVSLFQALQETPKYAEEDSYRVHATVQLAGAAYPRAELQTLSAPGPGAPAALSAALGLALRFNAIYSSTDRQTQIAAVKIAVEVLPGRHAETLSRAVLEQTTFHAGDRITVAATVKPYRGAARQVRIPMVLPASLPSGDVRLLVSDGPALDRAIAAGRGAGATPLSGTIAQLNALHPDDRLYVTLLEPDAQLSVDGRALDAVPLSVANLLLPAHDRDRGTLHSESVLPLGSIGLDANFAGEQILTLRVE